MAEEGGKAGAAARRPARTSRAPRRGWLAWLASALVHGLLVLGVRRSRWTWTQPQAMQPSVLQLEVLDLAAPPPEPVAASPPRRRSPAEAEETAKHRATDREHRRYGPAPSPVRAPQAVIAPAVLTPARAAPAPTALEPPPAWMRTRPLVAAPEAPTAPASAGDDGHGPRLSLDGLSPSTRDRLAGPAVAHPREPRISVDRLRIARERDEDAVANVRVGRVDPFLHEYVRDARVRFEEGARHIAEQLPLGAQKTAETWIHGYGARLAQVNAQAAAARNGARRQPDTREGDSPEGLNDRHPPLLDAFDEATRAADAGAVERHVTVCVTVAAGQEATVVVKRESRDPALDQLAREAFARAVTTRPAPADAHAATACYDLRIRAFRMPPLPVISCGIDKDGPTCVWPFKKITSVSVHLESVDYPADHAAPPALVRRPH